MRRFIILTIVFSILGSSVAFAEEHGLGFQPVQWHMRDLRSANTNTSHSSYDNTLPPDTSWTLEEIEKWGPMGPPDKR